jgi:hypothetical protein
MLHNVSHARLIFEAVFVSRLDAATPEDVLVPVAAVVNWYGGRICWTRSSDETIYPNCGEPFKN